MAWTDRATQTASLPQNMVLQAAWTITEAAQGLTGVLWDLGGVVTARGVTWQAPSKAGTAPITSSIAADAPMVGMAGEMYFAMPIYVHSPTMKAITETAEQDEEMPSGGDYSATPEDALDGIR